MVYIIDNTHAYILLSYAYCKFDNDMLVIFVGLAHLTWDKVFNEVCIMDVYDYHTQRPTLL